MNTIVEKLGCLEEALHSRIRGQSHIIPRVMSILERGELGLHPPGRPKGSLIFLGPTGVGKTQLTLEFSEFLFGKEGLVRFDMSEFLHLDHVKLFAGEGSGGRLGRALKNRTQGVLLLDEIEKAHPQLWDLLLQIVDAAHITLGDHSTLDLSGFYIVCTSNIGSEHLLRMTKLPFATIERAVLSRLQMQFRPELVGRFDEKLVFRPLDFDVQREIALAAIDAETQRLAQLGYSVTAEPSAVEFLIRVGIHCSLGARPLKQAVYKYICDAICWDFKQGGSGCGVLQADEKEARLVLYPLEKLS